MTCVGAAIGGSGELFWGGGGQTRQLGHRVTSFVTLNENYSRLLPSLGNLSLPQVSTAAEQKGRGGGGA